tara:strand:+ start:747 stop:1160 length:414 start_codon:yes stop_codon:yes gene_type:complete
MQSIFSRIIEGEIPSYKVAEDSKHFAFLDISPLKKGHVLVVPKQQIDYIFDLEDARYLDLWQFTKKVSHCIKKVIPCKRIGVAVIGFEVPHAHIHLIPMDNLEDINFNRNRLELSEKQFLETSLLISSAFSSSQDYA